MKLAIVSRDKKRLLNNIEIIKKYRGYLSYKPDIVITLGGDGSFLAAERFFPGVPKLAIRDQSICNKCDWDNLEEGIKYVLEGKYIIKKIQKIQVKRNGTAADALNDIVIRNAHPTHAIRFKLFINKTQVGTQWIGDGVVISTAFGSEGYFRSITRTHFEDGIGIAFNNTTVHHEPIILKDAKIEIEIIRGEAQVAADNDPKIYTISEGKRIIIETSKDAARIVRLKPE